jgi:hypothetical protein
MTQSAWTRSGAPVDASTFTLIQWEALKKTAQLGDYVMTCCKAPAVLKTSPETVWHHAGKAAVLAGLASLGIEGNDEVPGQSPTGEKWEADVLFKASDRTIAIELQRSYQHLRDFTRRQERYAESGVECYWLVRKETFITLAKATSRLLLKRDYGNVFPPGGIGTGMLSELPVAMLDTENSQRVMFGGLKAATVPAWLAGILNRSYQYRGGSWNLD